MKTLHLFILFSFLSWCLCIPLYDVYNGDNEPPAIPMQLLRVPMQQIDTPDNHISEYEEEIFQNIFKRTHHKTSSETCCPTVVDIIEPSHGKNRSGDLVELYQSETVKQRFYENSCATSYLDQPCRFIDRKHTSKCLQLYSYTYAMVRDIGNPSSDWKLDYIQIRSACSCHIKRT